MRRLLAPAHDGEEIPVTVLTREDFEREPRRRFFFMAMGPMASAIPSAFSTSRLSLVDRGIAYAIAHIRGGRDKGHHWYRDGKLAKKKNTFADYIAAARHLAREGYAREGEIVGHGGSAGGLLMGAAANMARRALPRHRGRSAVRRHSHHHVRRDFTAHAARMERMGQSRSQTPKSSITSPPIRLMTMCAAAAYPHIFALGGLTDPRVTYWEPAKWVAKLRAQKTDDNLVLLRTNMEAGHGGAAGRFNRLEEVALVYAFMLKVCGRL